MLLAVLFGACSGVHTRAPRPAEGCQNISAALNTYYVVQSSDDDDSCLRADMLESEEGGISNVEGVLVTGPFVLLRFFRATGACTEWTPRRVGMNPSATISRTARGTLELDDETLVRGEIELAFDAAPDGSLGATEATLVAEDVRIVDVCPPD